MRKNKNDLRPHYNYFMDDYFSMVFAQLCSLKQLNQGKKTSILLIGLGGGVKTLELSERDLINSNLKYAILNQANK